MEGINLESYSAALNLNKKKLTGLPQVARNRIGNDDTSSLKSDADFVERSIRKETSRTHLFVADALVVVLGEVVEPDLGQTDVVALEDVDAAAPLVRRPFAEDVADVRARNDLQRAAAHPRLFHVAITQKRKSEPKPNLT